MASQTNVFPMYEVSLPEREDRFKLCLQWCRYNHPDFSETGYRFIWRRPDNSLQPARGQARIPSFQDMRDLMELATNAGWGDLVGQSPV